MESVLHQTFLNITHYTWHTVLGTGGTSVKDQKSVLSQSLQCSGETQGTNTAHTVSGGVHTAVHVAVKGPAQVGQTAAFYRVVVVKAVGEDGSSATTCKR